MIWIVVLLGMLAMVMQQRTVAAGRLAAGIATWLQAGRTPLEALRGLRDSTESTPLALSLDRAITQMEMGAPLSGALLQSGMVLPMSFLEGLHAVEESGQVREWLALEGERFAWRAQMRSQGILGLMYPIIVLFLLFEMAGFLATYIVPTFVSLIDGLQLSIPWETSLLRTLRFGGTAGHAAMGILVAGAVIAATVASGSFGGTRGRAMRDVLAWLPFVRPFSRLAGCEETASLLGALLHGGLTLPMALHTASRVVDNGDWRRILAQAERDVQAGSPLAESLMRQHVPPLFARMCAIGEQAEDLPEVLLDLGRYYQARLERYTRQSIRVAEAALVITMGTLVALYALAIWLPYAGLIEALGS